MAKPPAFVAPRPHAVLDGQAAAIDWPVSLFYKELMIAFPDARVIPVTACRAWTRVVDRERVRTIPRSAQADGDRCGAGDGDGPVACMYVV